MGSGHGGGGRGVGKGAGNFELGGKVYFGRAVLLGGLHSMDSLTGMAG